MRAIESLTTKASIQRTNNKRRKLLLLLLLLLLFLGFTFTSVSRLFWDSTDETASTDPRTPAKVEVIEDIQDAEIKSSIVSLKSIVTSLQEKVDQLQQESDSGIPTHTHDVTPQSLSHDMYNAYENLEYYTHIDTAASTSLLTRETITNEFLLKTTNLTDLNDVNDDDLATNKILKWNGSEWTAVYDENTLYLARNGIELEDGYFQLGGSLIENTTIDLEGHTFTFDDGNVNFNNTLYAGSLYQNGNQVCDTSGNCGTSGSTWLLAGDSGTTQTISDTNTVTIAGGTGLSSVASATDTLTLGIGAGAGISVGADDVSVDQSYAFAWTGAQSWSNSADFNGDLSVADTDIVFDGATTNFTTTGNFSINTNDLFVQKSDGNVGVGNTSPSYALDVTGMINGSSGVRTGDDFYVGSIGLNDVGISNITSGASVVGVFDEFTTSNATTVQGVLADFDAAIGGGGHSPVTLSGPYDYLTLNVQDIILGAIDLTTDVTGVLPLANGGTNKNITASNGAIVYSDADSFELSSVGISGQPLLSGGAGTPTFGTLGLTYGGTNADLSGASTGGIIFKGASALEASGSLTGVLKGNGSSAPTAMTGIANYVTRWTDQYSLGVGVLYDNGTNVGISTTSPGAKLDVVGGSIRADGDVTAGDLYLGFDDTSATITTADTDELLTLDPNGTGSIYLHGTTYYIDSTGLIYASGLATTGYTPTAGELRADVFRDGNSAYYLQPADIAISAVFAGNVGIGTTTPDFALQVNGVIAPETTDQDLGTTSLRWNIFANTINADNTVTLTGLGTGTDNTVLILDASNQVTTDEIDPRVWGATLVDGSGTTGYVTYWSDTDTLSSEQYLSTSRGGLGNDVTAAGAGEILYSTGTTTYDSLAAGNSGYVLSSGGAGSPTWVDPATLGTNYWQYTNGALSPTTPYTNNADLLVGSNATDSAKFAVLNIFPGSGTPSASVSSGLSGTSMFMTADGTLSTQNRMNLTLGNSSTYDFTGNILLHPNGTGNVGIGSTAPNDKLDVAGEIDTSTFYKLGGSKILDVENTQTLLVGIGAGNSIAAGANTNTLVGSNAGFTLSTGDSNTIVGADAGYLNTTEGTNTLIGANAGYNKNNGANTYIGNGAGYGATNNTAAANVAVGNNALPVINLGTYNIALGDSAGSDVTDGDYNIFIGANSGLSAGTEQNSIALGFGALVTASNQFVVGSGGTDDQVTDYYFGSGVTDNTPFSVTFNASGGSGTNIAGANFTLAGGKATGNADGGDLIFSTTDVGSTGATIQTLTEKMRLTDEGNLGIGTSDPSSFKLQVAGSIGPQTDDTYDLGSNTLRWKDLYLGGETIHIGTSTSDEGTISYDTTNNIFNFGTDSTTNGDIAFFTDDLYLDKSAGNIGINTTTPAQALHVIGDVRISGLTASLPVKTNASNDLISGAINLASAEVTGILPLANGGTNKNATAVNGGIVYSDADSFEISAAGTSGQALLSGGAGTPTWGTLGLVYGGTNADLSGISTGSIIYKGAAALEGSGSLTGVLKGNGSSAPTAMTGTANYVTRWTDANTLGTGVIYDDGTNVGISTTSPASFKLEVAGSIGPATNNTYDLGSNAARWANVYATNFYQNGNAVCDDSGNCAAVGNLWQYLNGAISPATPYTNNSDLLVGSNASDSAKFAVLNVFPGSGTPIASVSSGLSGTSMFMTADGTLATQNRMSLTIGNSATYDTTGNVLINSNGTGNVGIGTTAPVNDLDVVGYVKMGELGFIPDYPEIIFNGYYNGTNQVYTTSDSSFAIKHVQSTDYLSFNYAPVGVAGNTAFYTSALAISLTGNVGINSTAPGTTLDVTGTGRFSSTLTASNGLTQTTGALNLTATSGTLSLSGMSASSMSFGANNLTVTAGNFNTTATGINTTAIGATARSTGAFTTLAADSTVTFSSLGAGATDTVVTHSSGVLQTRTIDTRVWGATLADGSGVANYVARWSDADSLTTGTLYDDGTNVGIGIAGATTNLQIRGATNDIESVTATAGNLSTEWNNDALFKIDQANSGGNAMAFSVSGTANERKGYIQVGHTSGAFANLLGDLALNPFGGNVGIGTTVPSRKLSVETSGASSYVKVAGFGSGFEGGLILYGPQGTQAIPTANAASDTLGSIYFGGFDTAETYGARIYGIAPAAWGSAADASDAPADIRFATVVDGSDTLTDRMTVQSDGNVGIGTTAPLGGFDFQGSTATGGDWAYFGGNAGGTDPSASRTFGLMTGWNSSNGSGETELLYGSVGGGSPQLNIGAWDGAATTISIVVRSGNVGIASTANPTSELQIGGTTPELRIGDDGAEDAQLSFMGNAVDFHMGLDDSTDLLTIGTGTALGTNAYMVMNSSGSVGIGTTGPATLLHINGTTDSGLATHGLLVLGPTTGANISIDQNEIMARSNGAAADLYLNNDGGDVILTTVAASNVGIGIAAPTSKLHIKTDANADTTLTVNNATVGTAARAVIIASTDTGGTGMYAYSSAYTTSGGQQAAGSLLYSSGAGGLSIAGANATSGEIRFYTDGLADANERMTITNGGNVGIGSVTPGQRLAIVDAGNTNQYFGTFGVFANNLTQGVGIGYQGVQAVGSNTNQDLSLNAKGTGHITMQVSGATGNVGIGDSTPSRKLAVETSGASNYIQSAGYGTGIEAGLLLYGPRGTQASPTANTTSDILGSIYFGGWDTGQTWGARIIGQANEAWGTAADTSDAPTSLHFQTVPNGSETLATHMTIASTGNVGIGTTAPRGKFEVVGETAFTGLTYVDYSETANSAFHVYNTGNVAGAKGIWISAGTATAGTLMTFANTSNSEQGNITFNSGTVSYNAFTGGHYVSFSSGSTTEEYPYGTLLCLDSTTTSPGSTQPNYNVSRCDSPYESSVMGVYSQRSEENKNHHLVSAVGDGHVYVTNENGPIKKGDQLVASSTPGYAMKATKAGNIIGTATADWDGQGGNALLAIYYYPGVFYPGPNTAFSSEGELLLAGSTQNYTVTPVGSSPLSTILGASQAVVGKITAGLINTRELIVTQTATIADLSVTNLSISGQTINDYIRSIVQLELQNQPTALPADAIAQDFNSGMVINNYNTTVTIIQDPSASSSATYAATSSGYLAITPTINVTERVSDARFDILASLISWSDAAVDGVRTLFFNAPSTFRYLAWFQGPVKVNADTSGMIMIPASTLKARVSFSNSFPEVPTIYVNFNDSTSVAHTITDVNQHGFTINFVVAPSNDLNLQWLALLRGETENGPSLEVMETAATINAGQPVVASTPVPTPTPTAAPEAVLSPQSDAPSDTSLSELLVAPPAPDASSSAATTETATASGSLQ